MKNTVFNIKHILGRSFLLLLLSSIIFSAVQFLASAEGHYPYFFEKDGKDSVTLTINSNFADGKSNASYAINCALYWAKNNATDEKPCNVVIPAGTYRLEQHLNLYSNTNLYMKGATLLKCFSDSGSMLRLGKLEEKNTGYNGYRNISLHGGTWDGNINDPDYGKSNSADFTPIALGHVKNVEIDGVSIKGGKGSHLLEIGAADGVKITNCKFSDQVYTAANGQEALQLDIACYNVFEAFPCFDGTVTKNVVIDKCEFNNVYRGVGSHSSVLGETMDNITISNNTFKNVAEEAIIATNFTNSKIINNTVTDAGIGINFLFYRNIHVPQAGAKVKNVNCKSVISNNKISVSSTKYESQPCGIRVYGYNQTVKDNADGSDFTTLNAVNVPVGDYRVTGLTVSENSITVKNVDKSNESGKMSGGIRLYRTYNSTVTNNIISSVNKVADTGIYLFESCNNEISKNTVSSFSNIGINAFTNSSNNTVSENTVSSCQSGILLNTNSQNNKIDNNTINNVSGNGIAIFSKSIGIINNNLIKSPKNSGIYVSNSTASISSNNIQSPGLYGIGTVSKSKVTAVENTIANAKDRAVCVSSGTSAKLESNTVTSPAKAGIYVTSSKADAKKNTIKNNKSENGITFVSKSSGNIIGNSVGSSAQNGIYVSNSTASISSNNIQSPGMYGIGIVSKSKVTAVENTIANAKDRAVCVSSGSSAKLESNNVTSSARAGIYVTSSKADATKNIIKNNKSENGITFVSKSSGNIIGNSVGGSAQNGIYVSNSTASVSSNKVQSSNNDGIVILTSSKSAVIKNNVIDSKRYGIYLSGSTSASVKDNAINTAPNGIYLTTNSFATLERNKFSKIKNTAITVAGVKNGKTTTPATPKANKTAVTPSTVTLSWGKVKNVTGYEVYRAVKGKYSKIGTTKSASFTDKKLSPASQYSYRIVPYLTVGKTVIKGGYAQINASTNLPTPTLKVTAGKKQATVSWNKVSGATGYFVYYSTSKSGTYKKLGTAKGTSYTAKKLTSGKSYYFKVAAYKTVSGKNICSPYSAVKGVKIK